MAKRFKQYLLMLDQGMTTEAYELFETIREAARAKRAYEADPTVKTVNLYAELHHSEAQYRILEQG
jgi:hypothetical protein